MGLLAPVAQAVPWFPFGPDGGSARTFASDPTDRTHLYLGTANGWIYESHDGGKQWSRLARMGNRDDLVLKKILVDPADPKHIVAATYALGDHPDGDLYITRDAGYSWITQSDLHGQSIRSLTAAPSDPKVLVAGTLDGVFRSSDGGNSWQRISPVDDKEIHEVESLAIDPTDPNIIYAGTWHLPWKTTDGGASWTSIKQGIIEDSDVFSILVDPKQPKVVYISACSGIYKSVDGAEKFVKAPGIPSSARRTRVLMQDPNHLDTVFAGTTEGLYRTDDGGKLWTQTTGSAIVVNDVYINPADPRQVLLATDARASSPVTMVATASSPPTLASPPVRSPPTPPTPIIPQPYTSASSTTRTPAASSSATPAVSVGINSVTDSTAGCLQPRADSKQHYSRWH